MRTFLIATSFVLSLLLIGCSSSPQIPNKGADLDSLEAHANYITSKNVCKKMAGMSVRLLEKPFLLGAFDLRDGIAPRVPTESYNDLMETLHKTSSPLANLASSSNTPANAVTNTDETAKEFPSGLRTTEEQLSYLIAHAIAKSFGKNGIPVMPASMALGLRDTQTKDAPKISAAEEKDILKMIKEKASQTDNDWAENRHHYYITEEKLFFAGNITKPGVISMDSGVQYLITKKGNGKAPKASDKVAVNYRGSLLDGTEFDSSYKRNKPDIFKLSAMIPGFTQALLQIPAGSAVTIYIPATLAYGDKGNDLIPPHAALIFEVELLGIK